MEPKSRTAKRMKVMTDVMARIRADERFREKVLPPNGHPVLVALADDKVEDVLHRLGDGYPVGTTVRVLTRMEFGRIVVGQVEVTSVMALEPDQKRPDLDPGRAEVHRHSEWGMLLEYVRLHPDEPMKFGTRTGGSEENELNLSLLAASA